MVLASDDLGIECLKAKLLKIFDEMALDQIREICVFDVSIIEAEKKEEDILNTTQSTNEDENEEIPPEGKIMVHKVLDQAKFKSAWIAYHRSKEIWKIFDTIIT